MELYRNSNKGRLCMKKKNNIWKYMRETFSEFEVGKEYTNKEFSEIVEGKIISADENDVTTFDKIKRVTSTFTSGVINKGVVTKEKLSGRLCTYKKVGEIPFKSKENPTIQKIEKIVPLGVEEFKKDDNLDSADIGYSIIALIKKLENGIIKRNEKITELNEELKMFVEDNGALSLHIRKLENKIMELNNKLLSRGKNKINVGSLKELSDFRENLPKQ